MSSKEFKQLVKEVKKQIAEIRPEHLHDKMERDNSLNVIDIRENEAHEEAAIPGCHHLNRGILERDIDELVHDKSSEVILYCGGGGRSALAARNLQKMGYPNVYSLKGGFRAWKDNDLPVEQ